MGDLRDNNNKTFTVVLYLTQKSKKGNYLDITKISSVEGRGHIGSLFVKDGQLINICYANKNRIQKWLNVNQVQSPLRSSIMDSINSIPKHSKKSRAN